MQDWKDFSPTGFEPTGTMLTERNGWAVLPVTRTRGADTITRSNFDAALAALGGEGEAVEVHRLSHWLCGWMDIVLVDRETPAAAVAEGIEVTLTQYPVLDEENLGHMEREDYLKAWQDGAGAEYATMLSDNLGLHDENKSSLLEQAGSDEFRVFFESRNPAGDYVLTGIPNLSGSLDGIVSEDMEPFLVVRNTVPSVSM